MVLHMLRGIVGDETFRAVLKAYSADAAVRYGTATTADFRRIVEAVAGGSYETFFRQWVTEGTGYPAYRVGWSSGPGEAGHEVTVTITQTQEPPASSVEVFEMPVTLAVQTTAGEQRFTVFNDAREQRFTLQVDAPPTGLVFDPGRLLLRAPEVEITTGAAGPGRAGGLAITDLYPNPASSRLQVGISLPGPGPLSLTLHDALGRRVRVLFDGVRPAGTHRLEPALDGLPAGMYFLHLTDGRRHVVRGVTVAGDPPEAPR
jgi:hypothetical protein